MTKVSYSQNGEDIRLARALAHIDRGFYVDVGAAHPVCDSVTKLFHEKGWSGVNIEPGARFFEMLAHDRPGDINLNIGISDQEGTLEYYETTDSLGMSSFSPDFVAGLRRCGYECVPRVVPVTTLKRVCEKHVGNRLIDFMKIDVEGHEGAVIAGADWQRWRPRILVIEATKPETWEPTLLNSGFLFVVYDGINRYYVRDEDKALSDALALAPNLIDGYERHDHIQRIRLLTEERDRALAEQARLLAELETLKNPPETAVATPAEPTIPVDRPLLAQWRRRLAHWLKRAG